MRIAGRDALSSLETAITDVRGNENKLAQVLSSATNEADRLRKQVADSYKALALIRLDHLMQSQVAGDLDAAERRALDLMRAHRARLDQVLERLSAAQKNITSAELDHRAKTTAVEAARALIEDMTKRIEAATETDPVWQTQNARVKELAGMAAAADAKIKQSEADRDVKRKPYEADPLFMYLWNRKFATSAYSAGNVARFFDRGVARLVGYDTARPNYTLLNDIPARLREHANQLLQRVQDEDKTLAEIERRALTAAGIEPLEKAFAEAQDQLKISSTALTKAQQSLTVLDTERAALTGAGDRTAHQEALAVLTQAIAHENLQTMYQEARQTPSPEDDRLVQQIESTQSAITKAENEVAKIREEAREIARRRSELETVRDRMRTNRYDRPNSEFEIDGSDVLGGLIGGIIGGVLQSSELWEMLDRSHRKRRDWDDDDDDDKDDDDDDGGEGGEGKKRGPWGQRSPPRFRFPSSSIPKFPGGFGGGGFKTGGGFKGGGFKTGGRF